MSRGDISAGRAFVELFVKQGALVKGLRSASSHLKSWGQSVGIMGAAISAAGTAAMAPMAAAVAMFVGRSSDMAKLSKQIGATVEDLSRMQFAAERMGVDAEGATSDLMGAFEELNIRMGETLQDGTGPMSEAFQKLGLDAEQLAAVPLPERIGAIADALNGLESETDRGFLADEIFGGDAFKILPLLREGGDAIRDLAAASDELGATVSGADASVAGEIARAFIEIKQAVGAAVFAVGAALAPVLKDALAITREVVISTTRWVRENAGLVRTVALIAAGTVALGAAITGVGLGLTIVGVALGGIASTIALVMSPGAAIVVLLGSIVAGWATVTESGRSAVASLRKSFGELLSAARSTFTGIFDAIIGGDFKLAGAIAMQGLQLVVMQGMNSIASIVGGVWGDTIAFIGGALLAGDVQGAWKAGIASLGAAWGGFATFMVDAMSKASKAVVGIWEASVKFITKQMMRFATSDIVKKNQALHDAAMKAINQPKSKAPLTQAIDFALGADSQTLGDFSTAEVDATVDSVVGAMADKLRAGIDGMATTVADAATDATANLKTKVSGAADAMGVDLAAAQKRLDELTAEAKAKADARRKKVLDAAGGAGGAGGISLGGGAAGVVGSFSASALQLMAGRGERKIEKDIAEAKEIAKMNLETDKKILARLREMLGPEFG